MFYKTMFIDAPLVKGEKKMGTSIYIVNGDQFARDIDAAIHEKAREGFELFSASPVASSKIISGVYSYNFTSGMTLIFKKAEM